ncbi:MAG: hypothetical protein ACRDP7_30265 [Trebonia sp.]
MEQRTCFVVEDEVKCDGITGVPGTARGMCSKHYNRDLRYGDPLVARNPDFPTGENHHLWRGADVGYKALHRRVYVRRGKAAAYGCEHCNRKDLGIRYEWATVHGTDGTDPFGHYISLCVACHRAYDLAKLTLEDREHIRLRVLAGDPMRQIAKDYGIHYSVISKGLNLRSLKWGSSKRMAS